MNKKQKKAAYRIALTVIILIVCKIVKLQGIGELIGYLAAYVVIGYDVLLRSVHGITHKQVFDENFLMAVATVGAIALGDYSEAVSVMLFYQIGELFESIAVGKSRKSISALMDIRPEFANIEKDGELIQVDPSDVQIGEEIVVRVGEKIPLDGVVVKGETTLNTSALTGESKPKDIKENDEVISGCINMTAPISIKTTKLYEDSTVSKVLDLIENATSNKSKSEDFISKFARYYTPAVCYSALALVVIPPLFNMICGNDADFSTWLYRAFTFLVISCPCALVISIPLTFFAGIGGASKAGVLIKGSNHLENLSKAKYVVFDKTGTMTKGVFEVEGIHHNPMTNEELLEYAALAEIYSIHPIAESIKKAYGKKPDQSKVQSIREISGQGIVAIINGKNVLVGNETLMENNGIDLIRCHCVGTIIHIAIDGSYMGHILINDIIKPSSRQCIRELKKLGISKTIMLTGDLDKVAQSVKDKLNIDEVKSELLPQDKVAHLEEILKRKTGKEQVVFVGDGINDAPSIARADIGISMGALGSDAAIEAADIVLMDDDPLKIATAIKIARRSMLIVYENIYFAIGVKIVALIMGAFGISTMWMAIFADVGVMIIDVINAVRALLIRRIRYEED